LSYARGQDQEHQLIDRLLKPDMSLQNPAQNKKFIAANGASINKHATASTFYVQKKSNWKSFSGPRNFSAWQFNARSFRGSDHAANFSSRKQITNSKRSYSTQTARSLHDAHEAGRTVDALIFAGNRASSSASIQPVPTFTSATRSSSESCGNFKISVIRLFLSSAISPG